MDRRLSAINADNSIRMVAAITTDCTREAIVAQQARPSEALVLARSINSACLMASLAKAGRERLRIHIRNRGSSRSIIADAHGDGRVRACLERRIEDDDSELAALDPGPSGRGTTARALGAAGELSVIRDLGLGRPYQGTSSILTGEIDEDLTEYLGVSEQLPSVLVSDAVFDPNGDLVFAAGILAQTFPGAGPDVLEPIVCRLTRGGLYRWLETRCATRGPQPPTLPDCETLLAHAFGSDQYRSMGERQLRFYCPCGPENARAVLSTLGADELDALADEQPQTTIECHFCARVETLNSDDLRQLAADLRTSRNSGAE